MARNCPNGYTRDYLLNAERSADQEADWGMPPEWVEYSKRVDVAVYRLHCARLHEEEAALIDTMRTGNVTVETYRGVKLRTLQPGHGEDHLLMCEALLAIRYTPAQAVTA